MLHLHPAKNRSASLELRKEVLKSHRVYGLVNSPQALCLFMQHHVMCVLDFMWLLKSLQQELTVTRSPWTPPADGQAARLINEIVLGEESDQLGHRDGAIYGSHFEWYLDAMQEAGCERGPVDALVSDLEQGQEAGAALAASSLPVAACSFSRDTLATLKQPIAVRAAVFFHGREDVIPRMFLSMVAGLREAGMPCEILLAYLERHIEVDSGTHGPMAEQLLDRLCRNDPGLRQEAEQRALEALKSRGRLWDAIGGLLAADGALS